MSYVERQHYRIVYPPADRPQFLYQEMTWAVHDISEQGVCFVCAADELPKKDIILSGTLVFADGKRLGITGKVIRVDKDKCHTVIILKDDIPLKKIVEEQLYLIQRYNDAKEG